MLMQLQSEEKISQMVAFYLSAMPLNCMTDSLGIAKNCKS